MSATRPFVPGQGPHDKLAAADVAALVAKLRALGFTAQALAGFVKAGATRQSVCDELVATLRNAPKRATS